MSGRVPHIVFEKKNDLVFTSPLCERGDHRCHGHGMIVTELELWIVHIQWQQLTHCACVCHFERKMIE